MNQRTHSEQYWLEKQCREVVARILTLPDAYATELYEYNTTKLKTIPKENLEKAYESVMEDLIAALTVLLSLDKERHKHKS